MFRNLFVIALLMLNIYSVSAQVLRVSDFGLHANNKAIDASPIMKVVCDSARVLSQKGNGVIIEMEEGRYYFHTEKAVKRRYFISNHDQTEYKKVGVPLENLHNVTLQGNGAEFIFYGSMLPLSLVGSKNCTLQDFSIDFINPHISQAEVISNNGKQVIYRLEPWVEWTVKDSVLYTHGEDWEYKSDYSIAFDGKKRNIIADTSDMFVKTKGVYVNADGNIVANGWNNNKLKVGDKIAIRTGDRPAPGIFLADNVNTKIENITVHYAEGMGLLAQMCENIDINKFNVALRNNDPRYFTTQADATHFSGCKGIINVRNGIYESMMDDAINVHGTYLRIVERTNNNTLLCEYMHIQSYGFRWGEPGDEVQFVQSNTMEIAGEKNHIKSITPVDAAINDGVKLFSIEFTNEVPVNIDPTKGNFGVENLTWTPEVVFEGNIIRNNRARGALFSTPRKVVASYNLFDHTSGSGILLCGDCNGWYETGACRDVLIEGNTFINPLTSMFQFTNAIISIFPEIPQLEQQKQYFHSGIVIRNNVFNTSTPHLLYAKSVDGIVFKSNIVKMNNDFPVVSPTAPAINLERVINAKIDYIEP